MATAAREDNKQPERSTTKELSYLDALEHEADGLSGCRAVGGGLTRKTQGNEAEIYYNNTQLSCAAAVTPATSLELTLAATLMKCSGSRKTENGARSTENGYSAQKEGEQVSWQDGK